MTQSAADPFATPEILLAPAAGEGVGGGHVMRCLTLATALAAEGARCRFVVTAPGAALVQRFAPDRFELLRIGSAAAMPAVVARARPSVFIIDDYGIDAAIEMGISRSVGTLMVIDDLANRPHAADIVLDPGYGRTGRDYLRYAPKAVHLMGPNYALVARGFGDLRPAAAAEAPAHVDRIFVSFGLADPGGIAARAVAMLKQLAPAARLEIALASDAQSARQLAIDAARDNRLRVHLDARNVAELMRSCDICVGAGGSGVWERAALGKPSLAVIVADNQRELVQRLTADGLCVSADMEAPDFEAGFAAAFTRLQDQDLRTELVRASMALCDGRGADRAAAAVLHVMRSR